MKKKGNLGPVVKECNGYAVRMMVKTAGTADRPIQNHTGEYGVYAGKKLVMNPIKYREVALAIIHNLESRNVGHGFTARRKFTMDGLKDEWVLFDEKRKEVGEFNSIEKCHTIVNGIINQLQTYRRFWINRERIEV